MDVDEESNTNTTYDSKNLDYQNFPIPFEKNAQSDHEESASVHLDPYFSDFNLRIHENQLKGDPHVVHEFPFAYAGVKATHGFKKGKIYFEVKWLKSIPNCGAFGFREVKHILRVGWSDAYANLQLGEDYHSYGYDSQGKFYFHRPVRANEGCGSGSVIGCSINLDMENEIEIKYFLDGKLIHKPKIIPKKGASSGNEKVWYPHILTRNVVFEANFGSETPVHEPEEGYVFPNACTDVSARVKSPTPPSSTSECELYVLYGLPASGKTKWANQFRAQPEQRDKHFMILGQSDLLYRSIKNAFRYSEENDPKLYKNITGPATRYVKKIISLAPLKKRNYILDYNHIPAISQILPTFSGFKLKAAVLLWPEQKYNILLNTKNKKVGVRPTKGSIEIIQAAMYDVFPELKNTFESIDYPWALKEKAIEIITTFRDIAVARNEKKGKISHRKRGGKQVKGLTNPSARR